MNSNSIKRSHQSVSGFSLVELMIVLVIVGVIATFSVLGFQSTMRLHRVDTAVSLISSRISEARSNAIKRNRNIRLAISAANRSVQVFDGTTAVGTPEFLPASVTFSGTPPTEIVFDSVGRLTTASQTVTVRHNGGGNVTKAVNVSVAGKVTVQSMTAY